MGRKKEDWIIQLHKTVKNTLEDEGINITSVQDEQYYPHMTFCRIPKEKKDDVSLAMVEQSSMPWIFTIGSSDKNGQFLG